MMWFPEAFLISLQTYLVVLLFLWFCDSHYSPQTAKVPFMWLVFCLFALFNGNIEINS